MTRGATHPRPTARSTPVAPGRPFPDARPPAPVPDAVGLDEIVVALDGELDLTGVERLRALLDDAAAPRRRLVLDLSAVTHVSAVSLAVLVSGHRRLRDAGGALVVRAPSPAVVRELRISGLHRVIAVEPPASGSTQPDVAGTTTST